MNARTTKTTFSDTPYDGFRGIFWGVLLSLPLWTIVLILVLA